MGIALRGKGAARCMILAAAAFAGAAQAQDPGALNGFRLPPAPSPSTAPAEGPVDAEHPVATPTSPAPQPSASDMPRITLPPVTAPERRREAEEPRFVPVPVRQPTPIATEEAIEPAPAETPRAEPAPMSTEAPQAARADEGWGWWLPLLLGLIGLLTIGLFYWWLSRPDKRSQAAEFAGSQPAPRTGPEPSAPATLPPLAREGPRRFLDPPVEPVATPLPTAAPPQVAAAPEPKPRPAPVQIPRPAPQPVAAPPAPAPAPTAGPLALNFVPRTLQISLVYATLAYQLEIANRGAAPLTGLRVFADMISAHASQSSGQQLSMADAAIERRHEIAGLAPGETARLRGQLQLPLAEILPVRAGKAELFVPLARFLVEATGGPDASHIYSLGLRSERTESGMAAFRLDLGPQLFREIMQREVDVARWLAAGGARKAG